MKKCLSTKSQKVHSHHALWMDEKQRFEKVKFCIFAYNSSEDELKPAHFT
jgi:hypothetical protein